MDKNNQLRGHNLKGSLLTISKKMEILKRYEELKETNKHPEKAWFGWRFVEYLFHVEKSGFLQCTSCEHCLDAYSMYMHYQPNGDPDTFVSLALVGRTFTRRIGMIYSCIYIYIFFVLDPTALYHL